MKMKRHRLSLLTGAFALALLAGLVPAVAAAATPAASSADYCTTSYLNAHLNLPHVTADSAAVNSTGSFTAPGQTPLTGLPSFCDVTLTQTDSAGNPIDIEVWLPAKWNGRFQGVGGHRLRGPARRRADR